MRNIIIFVIIAALLFFFYKRQKGSQTPKADTIQEGGSYYPRFDVGPLNHETEGETARIDQRSRRIDSPVIISNEGSINPDTLRNASTRRR